MRLLAVVFIALTLLTTGCNSGGEEPGDGSGKRQPIQTITIEPYATGAALPAMGDLTKLSTDPAPVGNVITLKPGERLKILADGPPSGLGRPAPVIDKRGDTVTIFGPGGGQHVEILIDDEETTARIATGFPIELDPLSDGPHLVRIYLCASNNECVKHVAQVGYLQVNINKEPGAVNYMSIPTIAYTQPLKECRARNVVLDFALHGIPIGSAGELLDGYTVLASVGNGSAAPVTKELTKWRPCDINNLTPGKYTITLKLKKNGTEVTTPFAATTRTFYVIPE